ncbi:MAG: hypothetical protein ABIK92_21090 [Pseudomonadota bacterium]
MKEVCKEKKILDTHIGCFGNFSIDDTVCKKFCALSLKCYVERNQNVRIEIIEELVFGDNNYTGKMQ